MDRFIKFFIGTYKRRCITIGTIMGLLILSTWIIYENTTLELNEYKISSKDIPNAFDGFKIAHISDLHNAEIGEDNETLLAMLKRIEPDIIAITGDIIDSRNTNLEVALEFIGEAVKITDCYYVTGNHEARVSEYSILKQEMEKLGVIVLENEQIKLEREEETITLLGIEDPSFQVNYFLGDAQATVESALEKIISENDGYRILLSHRPELFDLYVKYDINLVFSGHAHGGQFRLPYVGGIIAPNQGFFPKYDSGLYTQNKTSMIVSRGIGNSLFPFRVNNPPEIIVIELVVDE